MTVLAVFIPLLMLGVLLMLGLYEDLLLPGVREQVPDGVPAPQDTGPRAAAAAAHTGLTDPGGLSGSP